MDPDKFQQAWQAHTSRTRVTVDADLLLKEVQRNQRDFRATIFRRDLVEVGVALLLIPTWFYLGIRNSLPWTWYLAVPAIIWVAGFILVDRMRHKPKPTEPGDPLLESVQDALPQVEHQIWLLRNVFWWYLLPLAIPIAAFFAQAAWNAGQVTQDWLMALAFGGLLMGFLFATYYFIYRLNQRAVRLQLEPRRQELLALLTSLRDETSGGEYVVTKSAEPVKRPSSLLRWSLAASLCGVALVSMALAGGLFDSTYDGPARSSGPAGDSLAKLITAQRKEKNLVGLAAMVSVDGTVEAAAADGERKKGSGVPLEISDRWHLGGIAKSITATMIARLIESGQMQWSDTIGKSFPEASVHADWKPVTLQQLLTDTAGAPPNFPKTVSRQRPALGPECTQARREAVLNLLTDKPASPPGKKYVYSNVGYTIVAAMAEKATGATWEDLVKREVFEPLQLSSAGFGPPKSPTETLPQPRGHRKLLGWKIAVSDEADNTAIIGPTGMIHMTLRDLSTYATEHLRGDLGEGKLLSAETYKLLHTPALNHYACGWIRNEPGKEMPYTVYWHNGSNTMWYALVAFLPETKKVVAVTSNDGDIAGAEAAAWEIVKASVKQFDAAADGAPAERGEQPPAARPPVPIDNAQLFRARIDEFLSAARTKAGFSGAVVVARGGQSVYQGALEFSHLESKAPNTLDTPFRIAGLSKQFTAAAIFRLESQGILSIDDPVHQHLSEFAESPYRGITIHHLLTETSGLPRIPTDISGGLRWNAMSQAATPVDDYVRLAVQMPLEFEPGTDYLYSNFSYRVLAALIARATGRDFADFMELEVFRPLGMNHSGVARVSRPSVEARIAEGLTFLNADSAGQPLFADGEDDRNFGTGYGSGGIFSSANDLLRWDRVLAGDKFLSESQKTRFFQPLQGDYACGWIVKESDLDGPLYQMHSGANEGFFSRMMRLPDDDLVIIAVGNVPATPAIDKVLEQLFRLCRSLPYEDL